MKRILITGTNRGLGKQVVRLIATNHPEIQVIATVRNNIEEAQQSWNSKFNHHNITCYALDINSGQSITEFVTLLKHKQLTLDAIINNAAIGADLGTEIPSVDLATKTFKCNFTGTVLFTNQILCLLNQKGRIINVSSKLGGLSFHPQQSRKIFQNSQITLQNINYYIQQYIKACAQKKLDHYYKSAYGTSKAMINAWSRFILQKQLKQGQSVICMSPGACATDMGPKEPRFKASEGGQFIYNLLWIQPKPNVFYHTNNESNFFSCG